jgi:hypothetical protein
MGRSFNRTNLFYRVVLPAFVVVNLGLGLYNLSSLTPRTMLHWVILGSGAFSVMLAGWLAGTWWSRIYWRGVMDRQVHTWRGVVDAVFGWIEEIPVSQDSLRRLKSSIERTLPG